MLTQTEQARQNMVENQVRTWEVLDPRVLDVLRNVRREDFVPARPRNLAFADIELPIGHDEVMLKPVIEGRLLQALSVQAGERVLEVGTGSGFLTACIARLAGSVISVERHADLAEAARARLVAAQVRNAKVETADALGVELRVGRAEEGPVRVPEVVQLLVAQDGTHQVHVARGVLGRDERQDAAAIGLARV